MQKRTLSSFLTLKKNAPFFYVLFLRDSIILYLWNQKERSVLLRSFIKNVKEHKDRSVLLWRTEKNAKIVPFFHKERKRTQRLFHFFIKIRKERKECSVLLKRTDAQPCLNVGPGGAVALKLTLWWRQQKKFADFRDFSRTYSSWRTEFNFRNISIRSKDMRNFCFSVF